jgi:peptidoglycan/LPS O-acetylase OafA/YrhL
MIPRGERRLDTFVIQSPPDLAALFALGVLTAGIVGASRARRSWPWAWLALAAAAPVLATIWWQGSMWTLDHLFLTLALVVPLTIVFAALFENPVRWRRSPSGARRRRLPRPQGAPA